MTLPRDILDGARPRRPARAPAKRDSVSVPTPKSEIREPNPGTDSDFPVPVVASKLQATTDSLSWLWHGFIAEKGVTLVSALWKAGKTTLLAHLVRNMREGVALCGLEVTPATVLYITEEPEWRWAKRRDALGIGDNVHFICRPFARKPTAAQWLLFIDHVRRHAAEIGANLIVFDTLSALWPVYIENDAGEVQAALMPLWPLTEQSAVLLVHHLKKGDGSEATGSRGSGALPGFVDTIVELRRHEPNDHQCRKRVITAYGRDDDTPPEVIIELDAATNEYRGLGDRKAMKREEITRVLLGVLPAERPGMTLEEIKDAWPEDEFPRKQTVLETLADGADRGEWTRDGTGTRGHPFKYHIPKPQGT
jgi:hypothetical protein